MSSTYPKIWPRKEKDDVQDVSAAAGDELVNEDASREDVTIAPDPDNPFDFRHFLKPEKNDKKSDDSEYNGISSPDYRTGTGSAINTPQVAAARKPATSGLGAKTKAKAKAPTQAAPKAKKRKSPEPEARKTTAKKPPTVRLERRATTDPKAKSEAAKPAKKAAAQPPASKIKSAEIVHSSDESDEDADGEPEHEPEPVPSPQPVHRSPSPPSQSQHQSYEPASDEDEDDEMEDADDTRGGLDLEIEFEIPDERPAKPKQTLRPNLGYLASPANGPISLASAASSVEGTPRRNRTMDALENDDGVIDFGDMGGSDDDDADGEVDDHDVVPMDLGPPAQTREIEEDADAEMEEEDPLYKEMMEGLAGGDSSEESEEE
ncbi:hypothetical protein P280DRAFT_213791 [Massarina eburnea CBS 473.64]|uniref:Transcription elongation factor Eaf N-terminal domain-containing protein n=1 Tax=Massarina eburnea CBS 473.64 TaxID=1395130 RepID=A0A6A6S7B5_9PLEO|nr:hypothetical protein P280DRAFT_213791 [Massarina eburnea CBS 473.64]